MTNDLTAISFNDIFNNILLAGNKLKKLSNPKQIDEITAQLATVCGSIGSDAPYKPMYVPEEYKQQWEDYLSEKKHIQPRALRYLCWEPEVASDKRFLQYMNKEQITISARSLQGIVRACHMKWSHVAQGDEILEIVRDMVSKYQGPNRILKKWNSSINNILSHKAPQMSATEMIKNTKPIKEHVESWGIDIQSEFFMDKTMFQAVQQCRKDSHRHGYLFAELLSWELWDITLFRKIIADFILDDYFNNKKQREILQKFILSDSRLGDPRLPRNNHNWLDITNASIKRFIKWLSIEDIGFFFEHFLPDKEDPHKRKDFWLQYAPKLISSRAFLCADDEMKLHSLLKDSAKTDHFGKIRGINSAYILDFGQVKVVEFNRVGACYIYSDKDFNQILPNIWAIRTFEAAKLSDNNRCADSVRHLITPNFDWRKEVTAIMESYGIRLKQSNNRY
jgi:hypothetical protein